MRSRCLALAFLLATLSFATPLLATVANYSDWWWNDQQSGHGLNIGQQNDVLFVSWFMYDETGAGMWLTMTATLVGNVATGNWVRTTGPQLGTTFDPALVIRTTVGTGTLTFASLHEATDFKATGNKVCTMNGALAPSGTYFKVEGTYSCVANTQTGTWTGTLLVRPPYLLRDEVLTIDGSVCLYRQTTFTSPSAIVGP
jgi:hypothetical protein